MFDDPQSAPAAGQVPPNLPIGEPPEDMFADTDDTPDAPAPVASQPIPAATTPSIMQPSVSAAPAATTSTALGAGVLRPKTVMTTPETAPDSTASQAMYRITEPSIGRGIILTVVIVVVAVVLGGGGWFLYQRFVVNAPTTNNAVLPSSPTSQPSTDNEGSVNTPATPVAPDTTAPVSSGVTSTDVGSSIIDDKVLFGEPVDTDGDGLDNTREAQLGTNPNNWDTDGDGLSDRDEVVIWKTDPLKTDTDGDGYTDGTEVKAGYNPLGPGKLFTPPTSTPAVQ